MDTKETETKGGNSQKRYKEAQERNEQKKQKVKADETERNR